MTRDEAKQRTLAARETGNFDEALRLAADLRLRFPDDDVGYVVGAAAARELQRFDEAEAILNEGVALFPDDPALLSELAWTVRAHGQLGRARDLAKQLREQFPGTRPATGSARSARANAAIGTKPRRSPKRAKGDLPLRRGR